MDIWQVTIHLPTEAQPKNKGNIGHRLVGPIAVSNTISMGGNAVLENVGRKYGKFFGNPKTIIIFRPSNINEQTKTQVESYGNSSHLWGVLGTAVTCLALALTLDRWTTPGIYLHNGDPYGISQGMTSAELWWDDGKHIEEIPANGRAKVPSEHYPSFFLAVF